MTTRFEKHGRPPIELAELLRVDLGHLKQRDAQTDDEEAEYHGDE
jgi:hypothetical protein